MGKLIDLTGQKFGKLTVVSRAESIRKPWGVTVAYWNCVCDCGNEKTVSSELLRNGKVKSCGCLRHVERAEDLSNKKFGRLRVIERAENRVTKGGNTKVMWKCQCDCGKSVIVSASDLKSGDTRSCGCFHKELLSSMAKTHGLSKSKIRTVWRNMIARCENPKCSAYKNYGGRGITVCQEWHDLETFAKWAFENGYDENAGHKECTIERKDVNGNYEPSNCVWVSMKEQSRNRRNNNIIEYNGEKKTIAEWAEVVGITYSGLRNRIYERGWSIEKAITTKNKKEMKT